jgi:hypothetical protein
MVGLVWIGAGAAFWICRGKRQGLGYVCAALDTRLREHHVIVHYGLASAGRLGGQVRERGAGISTRMPSHSHCHKCTALHQTQFAHTVACPKPCLSHTFLRRSQMSDMSYTHGHLAPPQPHEPQPLGPNQDPLSKLLCNTVTHFSTATASHTFCADLK